MIGHIYVAPDQSEEFAKSPDTQPDRQDVVSKIALEAQIQTARYAMFRLLRAGAPIERLREEWSKLETLLDTNPDSGAPQPRGESPQTNATQPGDSPNIAPPKPTPSLDTNSVADSTGEKAGTHGASKEAGGHPRGDLTPVSTLSDTAEDAGDDFGDMPSAYLIAKSATPQPAPDAQLPEFDDPRVQIVYEMLCDDNLNTPPNREEHWEGWVARNIVAALTAPVPSPDRALETEQEFEDRLHKEDARDMLRLIDFIADKIGLPKNQELSRDNFNKWFRALPPSATGAAEPVGWLWHSQDDLEWKYSHGPKEPECWKVRQPVFATPGDRAQETTAAGAIIDVMMGGKFDWRSRIDKSDFLESADWQQALLYARAALSLPVPPAPGEREALPLKELLNERDSFIVSKGLWSEFTNSLKAQPGTSERLVQTSDGFTVKTDEAGRIKSIVSGPAQAPQSSREG